MPNTSTALRNGWNEKLSVFPAISVPPHAIFSPKTYMKELLFFESSRKFGNNDSPEHSKRLLTT